MSIICIEGASAAGKTTVCRLLEELHGFKGIPEVNELFPRISGESRNWYFERQIDRWKIGCDISSSGGTAVLDGDPFQPIWYNWIFQEDGLQTISETVEFFRENVVAGNIQLPDRYYVLNISRTELCTRKNGDPSRTRRNFDKHLRLIEPQLDYFEAMNAGSARFAHVLNSIDSRNVAQKIATDYIPALEQIERIEAFERVCKYVCDTHDHQFREINRAVETIRALVEPGNDNAIL